jgi:SSS family solute:Na+ symporter
MYMSGITVLGNVLIETAGALYAGAIVVQLAYPDLPMWQIVAVLALLSGLYTAAGGLKAVVYTDAIQAVLLIIGATAISVIAFVKVGSWEAVTSVVTERELSLIQPIDDPNLPWLGLITGLPLLGIYFWCNNQFMVQRTLGARNLDEGRFGALFAGFLKIPVLFIMVFPGTFAKVLYPNLERADLVFPTMIFDLLPIGIRGVILVALIAAIMSSIDSTLNAVSTLVTMDFVKRFRPQTENHRLVTIGRITTITVMILGSIWAPQIQHFRSLFQYLQAVLAYISPPIVACFLLGVFWKRANGHGSFAGLMAGMLIGIALVVTQPGIHFLYVAPLLFVLCVVVIVVVSLMTAPPAAEKVDGLVWTRDLLRTTGAVAPGTPWYRNYRTLSVILLVFTLAVVGYFA